MPNHITNRIIINGSNEEVLEVLDFIKDEKLGLGTIDFNKITPMPKWVYGSNPNISGISMNDELKYGEENTCLGWARHNWGTKWNAYSQPDERSTDNIVYFKTAWNGVPDIIQK